MGERLHGMQEVTGSIPVSSTQIHREKAGFVTSEAFGRFLRLWMVVHAPTFRDPATPAAADAVTKQLAAGEDLYRRLAAAIAQHFMKGHRFVHDVLRVEGKAPPETVHKP
jgi:hypothetical protein